MQRRGKIRVMDRMDRIGSIQRGARDAGNPQFVINVVEGVANLFRIGRRIGRHNGRAIRVHGGSRTDRMMIVDDTTTAGIIVFTSTNIGHVQYKAQARGRFIIVERRSSRADAVESASVGSDATIVVVAVGG